MSDAKNRTARSFGAGGNLYFVIGFFGTIFLVIFGLVGSKNGDWRGTLIVVGIITALFLMLQVLRLKVGPDGFVYRTLIFQRTYDFDDISKGFFTVTYSSSTPMGVGNFCVELKDGTKAEVNIRLYVIGAAVALFDELERHDIPIEVPDLPAAHRMVREILKAKAKTQARSGTTS